MKRLPQLLLCLLLTACAASATPHAPTLIAPATATHPATPTPTVTPSPTATQTMEDVLYPYTIEGLRKHKFKSGKIKLGEKLLETDDFTRFAITYPSDGLTITGILQVPKIGKPPYPVIMMNHGFFSRTIYKSGDGTDRAAEYLNQRGYLTLASDYRSWGNSQTGLSLFYSGLAIDIINLMNAIPSLSQADPERIGMWGHSMGGGATLKVLTLDQRVKAAVLYSTVSGDFEDIIERWGPGCLGDSLEGELAYDCNSSDIIPLDTPPDLIAGYFNGVNDVEILKAVSPLYHLETVSARVQINYGTEDGLVSSGTPPEWSKKIYDAFIKADKDAQIFSYADEKHSFSPKEWFAFMGRTVWFFDKYVKNP
jgi:dipeptidyl aminopeptidase/acylaminoacyl peptidase